MNAKKWDFSGGDFFLKVFVFYRNYISGRAPAAEAEPVLPEHLVGDDVHVYLVKRAELEDGVVDGELVVIAQGSGHVAPEGLLEVPGEVVGDDLLTGGCQIVAEEGLLVDDAAGVPVVLLALGLVDADPDAALRSACWCRLVIRRDGGQVHLHQAPQPGLTAREDDVGVIVYGEDVRPESREHLHCDRLGIGDVWSHGANIKKNLGLSRGLGPSANKDRKIHEKRDPLPKMPEKVCKCANAINVL